MCDDDDDDDDDDDADDQRCFESACYYNTIYTKFTIHSYNIKYCYYIIRNT